MTGNEYPNIKKLLPDGQSSFFMLGPCLKHTSTGICVGIHAYSFIYSVSDLLTRCEMKKGFSESKNSYYLFASIRHGTNDPDQADYLQASDNLTSSLETPCILALPDDPIAADLQYLLQPPADSELLPW